MLLHYFTNRLKMLNIIPFAADFMDQPTHKIILGLLLGLLQTEPEHLHIHLITDRKLDCAVQVHPAGDLRFGR